jgi:hypothetical protein
METHSKNGSIKLSRVEDNNQFKYLCRNDNR